jgi:four helix bundle protein
MIRDVTDLKVYTSSLTLLKELYAFLRKVPRSEHDTVRNCKRAGKSIPTNLAEGFAKRSYEKEFKKHLKICIGSSDEVVAHLRTIAITVPRLSEETKKLAEKYKILSKRLNKLHKIWRSDKY